MSTESIRSAPHPGQSATPAHARLRAAAVSYTTNSIGDYVGLVALALLVYGETRDPLATAALFIATQFLPAFVAPLLTAHVDQLALRAVLPALYLGEAARLRGARAAGATPSRSPRCSCSRSLDGVLMLTARGLSRGAVNGVLQPAGCCGRATRC